MKKKLPILLTIIFVMVLSVIGLTACGGNKYKIRFVVDGEIYTTLETTGNGIIEFPTTPEKEGYNFDGWYYDEDVWEEPFYEDSLVNKPISNDLRVFAKWSNRSGIEYGMTFKTLTISGSKLYGSVPNSTQVFSFLEEITLETGVTYSVSLNPSGDSILEGKIVPLVVGDNLVYLTKYVNGEEVAVYEVKIRRKPTYIVSFNTNGGTTIQDQIIEEGSYATKPSDPQKTGYTFAGWNFDFSQPILSDKSIGVVWLSNTNTSYRVEYYLQNLEDDNYTLKTYENKTGTTDTIVNAQIKSFEHFTHLPSQTDSGSIAANGSTVLKVYYTRNKYSVTFNGNGGSLVSGKTMQLVKYGGSATAPVFEKEGYSYTYDKTFANVTKNQTITAIWSINQYTLTIVYDNGTSDKVIKQNYNTGIESIANPTKVGYTFAGWSESIPSYMPAEDKTITAQWQINQYTLRIIFNNGEDDLVIKADYGTEIPSVATPSKNNNVFAGWSSSIPTKMPAYDRVINATWVEVSAMFEVSNNKIVGLNALKQSVAEIVVPEGIVGISQNVFSYCNNLTRVELPTTLTSIESNAFLGCYNLMEVVNKSSSITITKGSTENGCVGCYAIAIFNSGDLYRNGFKDEGEYVIYENGNQKAICLYKGTSKTFTIPNDVTEIRCYAFYNNTNLTSITIGENVQSIGNYAFHNCTAIEEINFNAINCADLRSGNYVFYNAGQNGRGINVVFGDNVTHIPAYLFSSNCPLYITSVTIGEKVQSIGAHAFYYCNSLNSITIPNSVVSIGNCAFYGCEALKSVTIGNGVQSIGNSAFYFCNSLISVTIPNSVITIGESAFDGCSSLKNITIGSGVQSIGNRAFASCTAIEEINFNATNCADLSEDNYVFYGAGQNGGVNVVFGDNVTHIPAYLLCPLSNYNYSSKVTSITIGKGVTSIGHRAFDNCRYLTKVYFNATNCSNASYTFSDAGKDSGGLEVVFGDNVTCIPERFFSYDAHFPPVVTKVTIGSGVKSIEKGAFGRCLSLESVYYNGTIDDWAQIEFGDRFDMGSTNPLDIAHKLYINNELVTEVNLTTATKISAYAFSGCTALSSIIIGESVQSIGEEAFYGCNNLLKVINKSSNLTITKGDTSNGYVGYYASEVSNGDNADESEYTNDNGYIIYNNGEEKVLVRYEGTETNLILPSYITAIDEKAFYNYTSLSSITIPNSVQSIGAEAFYNCPIENATMPASAISSIPKTNLKTVVITSGTVIDANAFNGCSTLESITLAESIESIGGAAFQNCTALKKVNYLGTIDSWAQIEFGNECANPTYYSKNLYINDINVLTGAITINGNKIGSYAFYECTSLKSVTIGDSVQSIGAYAFCLCDGLTSVTIGENVQSIGDRAFSGCTALTSVIIGESVQSIGNYAFYESTAIEEINFNATNCADLSENNYVFSNAGENGNGIKVTFGNNVTHIPVYLFCPYSYTTSYSPKITSATIGESVQSIGDRAFSDCTALTSIEIPNSVQSIGNYAFYNCTSLTSVTIGNGVKSMGTGAFAWDNGFESVYYNGTIDDWAQIEFADYDANPLYFGADLYINGVKQTEIIINAQTINAYAFYHCRSLTKVTIGENVQSISKSAFRYCDAIEEINFNATNCEDLNSNNCVFYDAGKVGNGIKVTFGNNVTHIPAYLFYPYSYDTSYFPKITSVTIGNSVQSIGSSVFSGCTALSNVYFVGSASEWEALIQNSQTNTELTNATIYYYVENSVDLPNDEGNYWHYVDGVPTKW